MANCPTGPQPHTATTSPGWILQFSAVGIKRVVYAALAEDAKTEELIARGLIAETLNPLLTRGLLELVPGVLRAEGRELLD